MRIENLVFRLVGVSRREAKPDLGCAMYRDMVKLFRKAESSVRIVSGGFPYRLYGSEGIVNALKQALDRRCTVEVITGPEASSRSLKLWSSHGASVYVLSEWPSQHFAVIDGKHVRIEDPHSHDEEKRVQYVIDNFKNVGELNRKFEELKKQAKPLELE